MKNTTNRKLYTQTRARIRIRGNIQHNRTRPPPLKILFSLTFGVFVDSPVFPFLLEMLHDRCLLLCTVILLWFSWPSTAYQKISTRRGERRERKKNAHKSHTFDAFLSLLHIKTRTHAAQARTKSVLLLSTLFTYVTMFLLLFFFPSIWSLAHSLSRSIVLDNLSWMYCIHMIRCEACALFIMSPSVFFCSFY